MKRDVRIVCMGNTAATATIVNDKNGLSVINKDPSYEQDDTFIRDFLRDCINMDTWIHSRYVSVSDAKYRRSGARKELRAILDEKISSREDEIRQLRDAKIVLSKWHL